MKKEKQILLIEDNPGDAELIRAILTQRGGHHFQVHVEERLADAQKFLDDNRHDIDIVLLDLGLPDSQGVTAIDEIRARFPFLPIVVITGNDDENIGVEAVKRGAQDYIFKSLIPEHYLNQIIEYAIHRQEYEYRLKQSEEKYRSIVENIGIGVAMINCDKTIIETNGRLNEWFPGLDPKAGQKCYQTLNCQCQGNPDDDRCPVKKTCCNGLPYRGISRKGNITYRLLSFPLKNGSGAVKGAVLLMEDISERLSVESRLRQAQKMESLGTLAGGVAHDFNNILTAIQGFTTLAKFQAKDDARLMADLSEIHKAAHRASDLVKQILTFSRMGASEKMPVRVDLIIKEVLKLLRPTLPSNIEIRNQVPTLRDKIVADPTQIHQIMMNLCSNAAHAMEQAGGTLDISLKILSEEEIRAEGLTTLPAGPHLKLVVKDTGIGISPELMESIFDPYFTTKGIGEGTGLGLSMVQGIVTDCGGDILVESAPGQGSCFSLYFPVAGEVKAPVEKEASTVNFHGKEAILLVDDEPSILKLGKRLLGRYGYKIHTAANGYDALSFLEQNANGIDLIVSDMTMPKMTGLDLATELASRSLGIPLILMTGYSRMLSSKKAERLDISAVVSKPLSEDNLIAPIRKILDSRS